VVGVVQRAAAGRQQFHRLPDAARLVDRALLADRQVHRQVQERIGLSVAAVVDPGHGRLGVGQVGVVFGVLQQPLAGQRLQRIQGLAGPGLGMDAGEEPAHVFLRGVEHPGSVARG
jgi:hypothetical protein